jgi:peroxiredoxin
MKKFLSLMGILLSLSVVAQQQDHTVFVLKGKLQNARNIKLFLQNSGGTVYMDSTTTDSEGNFVFKGSLKEPAVFLFGLRGSQNYVSFQMENSVITINGDAKDIPHVTISGSGEQVLYKEIQTKMAPLDQNLKEIMTDYTDASEKKDSLAMKMITETKMPAWKAERCSVITDFIKAHPSSAVSVNLVADFVTGKYGPAEKADQLMHLIEATPAGKYSRSLKIRIVIDGQLTARTGRIAPDFTQPDTSNHVVSLSDLKGKYVLVDFWASWCHPCRAENPNVLEAYKKYKEKNFTVIAVSLDTYRPAWIKAIKDDQLPWLQLSDLQSQNSAAKRYGVISIPFNFLVDPSGKIIATDLRGEALENKLKEVLPR